MKLIFIKVVYVVYVLNAINAIPRFRRALGTYDVDYWTNATIPYIFDDSFSDSSLFNLQKSINSYMSETCLKFVKYNSDLHPNWLKFESGETCFSEIGMKNQGKQLLTLSPACRQYGLILHELGHTIGLIHEMMRPDRNQHIRYFVENVQEEAKAGFEVESGHYKLFNTPFDFQSIMMYSPYEYSKNGFPVWLKMNITDKIPLFDVREKDLSFWDVKAINEIYECGKHCRNINCGPTNYLDKNCVCQTPEKFAERRCTDDANHTSLCGNASETNICYDKPVVSSVLCRKTCGRCFRYGSHGNTTIPPYKCIDEDSSRCQRNKKDGFCFIDTWTKVNCKKSCNKCVKESNHNDVEFACKDRHNSDLCEEWARNDQCTVNPGFMKASCAMSCGSCTPNTTVTKPKLPCRNYSPDSYCDAMARENKCDGTTLNVCLGSCGRCGSNYERNEANVSENEVARRHKVQTIKECKDLSMNCEYFAGQGHCQSQKDSMKHHCSKTCNFCTDNVCKNEDSEEVCDDVKERGLCSSHAEYANRCLKTCQLCGNRENKTLSDCKDKDSLHVCREVLRRNLCNSNEGQKCQHLCGLCNRTNQNVLNQETTLKSSETKTVNICINEDSEETCEDLKERGLCETDSHRAARCRRSCTLCISTTTAKPQALCINEQDDENCESWASTGYCSENKDYMKENCAKACKFCSSNTDKSKPDSECKNKQNADQCNSFVERSYCTNYVDYMKINCPESCGFCNKSPTSPSSKVTKKTEDCKNIESDEDCESWSQNYCTVSHIAEMCRKTCGKC